MHLPLSTLRQSRNRLLQLLSDADLERLAPHFEAATLRRGQICIEPNVPIEHVYFLEGGLSSTVMPDERLGTSELGVQGYEGLIGVPVLLRVDRTPHKTFMEVGGPCLRIASGPLRTVLEQSLTLESLLLRYVHVFLIQTGQTAYANARYSIEERLARWVLLAMDRLGRHVPLTHEYLSYMLGVTRPGVTNALHMLEGEHLIKSTRGNIEVIDRTGLKVKAGGCYGVPEAEYERLIGSLR